MLDKITLGELKKRLSPQADQRGTSLQSDCQASGKDKVFEGIIGFDDTVLPDVERAVLSGTTCCCLVFAGRPKPGSPAY